MSVYLSGKCCWISARRLACVRKGTLSTRSTRPAHYVYNSLTINCLLRSFKRQVHLFSQIYSLRRTAHGSQRHIATLSSTAASSQERRVLFISPLWPERSSSAAGVRTSDLITGFQAAGWQVSYLSPAGRNEHSTLLETQGCATFSCPPNRETQLRDVLGAVQPHACIFDRFYAEEQFSFRVRELAPGALRVLDMQDFHALRAGRQELHEAGAAMEDVVSHRPDAFSPELLRELAAIHRSDLTLVCSPVEAGLLRGRYGVPEARLAEAPFFCPPPTRPLPGFGERQHFMTIGNFRHPPNLDAARWLAAELWPRIRAALPAAQLHVFGAYPPQAARQLHAPARGFHIRGPTPELDVMREFRLCLAPLRFGAGLKGKIVDSWSHGLPVATTPIGAEGMLGEEGPAEQEDDSTDFGKRGEWGGLWAATNANDFAGQAVRLYMDEELWRDSQEAGFRILQQQYNRERNLSNVLAAIDDALLDLPARRAGDFVGQMLWLQQNRSTEYFSRWIELKEQLKAAAEQPEAES